MLLRSSSCHGLFPEFLLLQNVENIATIQRIISVLGFISLIFIGSGKCNVKYQPIEMKINENIS